MSARNPPTARSGSRISNGTRFEEALTAEGQAEFAPFVATYGKLNKDQVGLELKPFRSVSDALRNYIDLSAMSRQENQADILRRVSSTVSPRNSNSTPPRRLEATSAAIGRRLDLLTGLGQAPELVDAVRAKFSQPNAFVTVSADLLRDAAAKPINRHDPITDVILGTRIRGRGHTTGTVDARHGSERRQGHHQAHHRRPRRFAEHGLQRPGRDSQHRLHRFRRHAARRVHGLAVPRAARRESRPSTRSNIHSVSKAGGGTGRRIVANVGMKKAHEKQGQANRIAAQHAEVRIANRMTDEIDKRLKQGLESLSKRLPPAARAPRRIARISRFSTTDSVARVRNARKPIAASSPRPPRRPNRPPAATSCFGSTNRPSTTTSPRCSAARRSAKPKPAKAPRPT